MLKNILGHIGIDIQNGHAKQRSLYLTIFQQIVHHLLNQLHRQWIKTRSEAAELKANWSGAELEQLQLIEIENQKVPSQKLIISCKSGKTVLRATAKCMQIGDRWYIGEDIKFGV